MKRKHYTPPTAEVILLSPCEALAATEWGFGKSWRNDLGYFTEGGASGIAVTGSILENSWKEDGFVIKTK